MSIRKVFVLCLTLCTLSYAQYFYTYVTSANDIDATSFSNSHNIAIRDEAPNVDSIHVVYHSSDSVCYVCSTDRGLTWLSPSVLCQGIHPGIDIDDYGMRHIVYQQYDPVHSTYDIFYDCLDDYSPPLNVSETPANSISPDIVIDAQMNAHIVWIETIGAYAYVFYRTCYAGVLSDTFRVSTEGSSSATFSYPSISLFSPNNRVHVLWDCYDSQCYSPFQIHHRYREDTVWSTIETWASYQPMRHSSIDFSHGNESLSFCYEDSSSGNLEAVFVGGNGGGFPTQGRSTYPVISTLGTTWSYLFWQEDSAGTDDIYYHLYYFLGGGWYDRGSVRSLFGIQEPTRFPNCCGAYMVWTQGDSVPYSIYFANFGYPVWSEEEDTGNQSLNLEVLPNPFSALTRIRYQISGTAGSTPHDKEHLIRISIYDATGKLLRQWAHQIVPLSDQIIWNGTDNTGKDVPAGIYFCILHTENCISEDKIVRLR